MHRLLTTYWTFYQYCKYLLNISQLFASCIILSMIYFNVMLIICRIWSVKNAKAKKQTKYCLSLLFIKHKRITYVVHWLLSSHAFSVIKALCINIRHIKCFYYCCFMPIPIQCWCVVVADIIDVFYFAAKPNKSKNDSHMTKNDRNDNWLQMIMKIMTKNVVFLRVWCLFLGLPSKRTEKVKLRWKTGVVELARVLVVGFRCGVVITKLN